jgi:hypothetical protein
MNAIIDFNSELLVDRSRYRGPHLRLLLAALGRELAKGSTWVFVDKERHSADRIIGSEP